MYNESITENPQKLFYTPTSSCSIRDKNCRNLTQWRYLLYLIINIQTLQSDNINIFTQTDIKKNILCSLLYF